MTNPTNQSQKEVNFNMFDWWKKVMFENYANFEGRARRSEYWYFYLMNILIFIALYIPTIIGAVSESDIIIITFSVIIVLYLILTFIPTLAVIVRRLHDTNKSGWLILLSLIPLGGLVLFIFYCIEGDKGPNQYGADPKDVGNEIDEIGIE